MPHRPRFIALTLALVLAVAAVSAHFVASPVALAMGADTAREATAIDSCTVIDQPGHYDLTANLTDPQGTACLVVRSNDVTVDGNGFTVRDPTGDAIQGIAAGGRNVTVENVTVEHWDIAIGAHDDATVRNVTVPAGTADDPNHVRLAGHALLTDSDVDTVVVRRAKGRPRIVGNDLVTVDIDRGRALVADNRVTGDIDLHSGGDTHITGNRVTGNVGVSESANVTVVDNHIDATGQLSGVVVSWPTGSVTVADNVVRNGTVGLRLIGVGEHRLTVEGNRIEANDYGVHVSELQPSSVEDDPSECAIRESRPPNVTVTDNVIADNSAYGVFNGDRDVLNATGNDWGAADGPASPDSGTVTDPVTGEPADGSGDAVSASPTSTNESNVHFDPASEGGD